MSPEQVLGKRVVIDGRTDLYSLGVTLYELLTLRPACMGRDRVELLHRIAADEPTPLRKLNPAVPRDLATVVHKAMAKEPSERYATAHELASDLSRFLESRPIVAVPPNPLVRAGKWMRRHREATLAMVLLVAALAVAASASAWDQSRRRIQLGHKVERLLGAAKASLQSADIAMALRHLAEARGHLTQARYGRGPLTEELDSLAQAASARSAAEDRFRQFQELRRHAHGSMNHLGADSLLSALDQGRRALSLYRAGDTQPWEPPKAFHDLPASLQVEAREGILELLFLTSRMEIKTTYTRKDREAAHRRSLEALGRIEAIQGPSSATSAWMAWNWEALGDRDRARQEDGRAQGLSAQTALEELMLAELMSTRGRPEDALAGYDRALRRRPNHLPSLFGEVRILVELNKFEAAEALLTGVIALAPDSPFVYSIRGHTRLQMGKYAAALVDFQKLAELNPDDYMAYYNQGHLLSRQGDYEHAVAMFDKSLKLEPNSFSSRLNRGLAYSELGRNEDAYADFTHVIDKLTQSGKEIPLRKDWESDLVDALMNRGLVSARLNRRDEALSNFNEALKINPKQAMAYHRRAEFVWTPAGRFREAVDDFSRAIELEPEDEHHWRCRANCFAHFGDNVRADEDMTRVVELKPDLPSSYLDRAVLRVKRGELQAAVADTERALGLPSDAISKVDLYNAACVSALAAAHASKDQSLAQKEALAAKYADRAVDLLRRAVAKGWAQPADLELMSKDSDLDSIRHHRGFEDLLRSIHSAGHPVSPSDAKPSRPSSPRTSGSAAGSIIESESDLPIPLQKPGDPLRSGLK
jgi:tetratricopeptide (TPR) repeat protein